MDAESTAAKLASCFYVGLMELYFTQHPPPMVRVPHDDGSSLQRISDALLSLNAAFAPYSIHAHVVRSEATAPARPVGDGCTAGADVKLKVPTDYHADAQWRRMCIGVSNSAALAMAVLWCALSRALLAGLCRGGIVRLRCMAC